MQAEKIKERTLQKKESIKSIEKWRKTRKHNDFADDGKAPEGFTDEKRSQGGKTVRDRGSGGGGQHGGGGGAKSTTETQAKREFKDDKFGFGGRKRVRVPTKSDISLLFSCIPLLHDQGFDLSHPFLFIC